MSRSGRRVVARRLGDAGQQRRLVRVIGGERGEGPAEVVFRRPRKSVLPVAHVHEAGVAGEDLFLRAALRPELLAHLLLEPQRQPDLFALAEHHVDVPRANHRRQGARQQADVPKLIAVFLRRLMLEKDAPHELLRDRRAALREDRPAAHVVAPSSREQPHGPCADSNLADHARHARVVHAVVREEALVLRGENRLTHDRRDVCVLGDRAVLAGQLDERLAVGVVDVTDGWEIRIA